MERLCIYHGNCADGFGAAYAVWMKFGDECEYYSGVYQNPPPDVTGKHVLMVDFSYKNGVIWEMAGKARTISILDHHKTACDDLSDKLPPNVEVIFDMHRSGAMIAWEFFHPEKEVPQLIRHIQDRDLWKFELPKTREIQAAVFSYPYDFDVWDRLMTMPLEQLATEGEAIERKHFKDINELLKVTTRQFKIGGYLIKVANLPYTLTSDAGHQLATESDEGIGGCYWDTPEGRVFSLRSTDGGLDVSEIAKQYGGGGHEHASGFRVSFDHELAT